MWVTTSTPSLWDRLSPPPVKRFLDLMAMSAGGWIGWIIGAWGGFFTAFIVSIVGTGVGLYASRRVTKRLLG